MRGGVSVGVGLVESLPRLRFPRGPVAQGLEQSAHNRSVGGSIPSGPTKLIDEAVGLCDQTLLAP